MILKHTYEKVAIIHNFLSQSTFSMVCKIWNLLWSIIALNAGFQLQRFAKFIKYLEWIAIRLLSKIMYTAISTFWITQKIFKLKPFPKICAQIEGSFSISKIEIFVQLQCKWMQNTSKIVRVCNTTLHLKYIIKLWSEIN